LNIKSDHSFSSSTNAHSELLLAPFCDFGTAHPHLTSSSRTRSYCIHLTMRFIALVAAALSSFAVVCAADANAALLVARRCPAACAINCPDVGDATPSIYSHSLRRRADIHARSSAAPTSTAPTSAVKSYWCGMQRRSGMWMRGEADERGLRSGDHR
jgi:hypothetical protein